MMTFNVDHSEIFPRKKKATQGSQNKQKTIYIYEKSLYNSFCSVPTPGSTSSIVLLLGRYANRAKNIKNKPKINEDPKDAMLRE